MDDSPEVIDAEIMRGFFDGIKPEPRLSVSEWADQYRILSYTSAAPGLWNTDRTPYLREVMDRLSPSDPCREVVFMKGSQIGATEAGLNWLGFIIDLNPSSAMMVMPTIDTVKRNSKIRIDPMIDSSPTLKKKVADMKSKDKNNTTLMKSFPGGVLVMAGANAASGLRSMPVRFLFLDEVDNYPLDVDNEGSPIDLAKARTRTFAKKKHFLCSTPNNKGTSVIEPLFDATDKRYYFVPCPHCGHEQHLVFDQLRWNKDDYKHVTYECIECKTKIDERHKTRMLADGSWIPTNPKAASRKTYGYHLNALYSPLGMYSWSEFAEEWDIATMEKSQAKLKVLTNTVLGLTWEGEGDRPDWEKIYDHRELYPINKIPEPVCFLTAGVDVQKDRLELEIVGWCTNRESYSIDFRVILGETSDPGVWKKLGLVLVERWTTPDGLEMPISKMAVDSGYNTSHVYDFCRQYSYDQVMPIKGQDSLMMPISRPVKLDLNKKGKGVGFVMLWHVGTSFLKQEIYGNLNQRVDIETGEVPPGVCHFPQYQPSYFKGLTAEKFVPVVDKQGFIKYSWTKDYERNEPLDCRVYARAAASSLSYDRMSDEQVLAMKSRLLGRTTKPKRKRRGGGWLD